jgi:cytochrome c553
MRRFVALVVVVALPLAVTVVVRAAADIPAWAYAIAPPPPPPVPGAPAPVNPAVADTSQKSLPGTARTFTRAQIGGRGGPPADWFSEEHPPMPSIVMQGRTGDPNARPCSLCHYPNGKGRPENAPVSGLPVSYFMQQLNDFRNDLRKSAEPRKANSNVMILIAKSLTPDEMRQAAEYFGAIKWTPWIRVVETNTVPKMKSNGGIWVPIEGEGAGKEPIGVRIMETPENAERMEILRDPHSGTVAYVPVGSIKKGENLVKTGGNGKTIECGACHGADLLGVGPVPGIAGRSPSYLARELYDMQAGTRNGEWTQLMKPVVAKLTSEDLVNIVAYVSSRPVTSAPTATK